MFELQEPSPLSYLKQLSPTHRFSRVAETTIEQIHPLPSTLNRNSIKVLSWNIAKNNYDNQWRTEFLKIIKQYQPDKIFLQEVRLCALKQQIPELASMGWIFAPNLIDNLHNTYSGVLTATISDRLDSQAIITQHQEPVTNTPKVSLFVEYALDEGKTLLAVNTHLINFVETSKFQAQIQAIEAVIAQHQGAVILSGDFNTWNLPRWLLLLDMTTKLGLNPVAFPWMEAQKIKRFLLSPPLDYIFYRGLKQKSTNAKVIDSITSSDHNPLLVEFYL
jgi:endonuclease/exonuclease/phosphatase (EEP) superfamily protein YafD